ncbi:hypothetical protein FF2_001634 [Malus domestica]
MTQMPLLSSPFPTGRSSSAYASIIAECSGSTTHLLEFSFRFHFFLSKAGLFHLLPVVSIELHFSLAIFHEPQRMLPIPSRFVENSSSGLHFMERCFLMGRPTVRNGSKIDSGIIHRAVRDVMKLIESGEGLHLETKT